MASSRFLTLVPPPGPRPAAPSGALFADDALDRVGQLRDEDMQQKQQQQQQQQ